jgi:vesicle coat complex subunit
MVINLFRKDVRKTENPLVRALAVRSFGCLRVPKLNDYLIEPLKEAMQDDDPYVRKTAVLCVPKVIKMKILFRYLKYRMIWLLITDLSI